MKIKYTLNVSYFYYLVCEHSQIGHMYVSQYNNGQRIYTVFTTEITENILIMKFLFLKISFMISYFKHISSLF